MLKTHPEGLPSVPPELRPETSQREAKTGAETVKKDRFCAFSALRLLRTLKPTVLEALFSQDNDKELKDQLLNPKVLRGVQVKLRVPAAAYVSAGDKKSALETATASADNKLLQVYTGKLPINKNELVAASGQLEVEAGDFMLEFLEGLFKLGRIDQATLDELGERVIERLSSQKIRLGLKARPAREQAIADFPPLVFPHRKDDDEVAQEVASLRDKNGRPLSEKARAAELSKRLSQPEYTRITSSTQVPPSVSLESARLVD